MLATPLSQPRCIHRFSRYDTDRDGELDRTDFGHAIHGLLLLDESRSGGPRRWDLSEHDVEQLFEHVDTNRSGSISLQEFLCVPCGGRCCRDRLETLNGSPCLFCICDRAP